MIKRAQFLLDLRGWAGKCTLRNKTALTGRWGPGMYGSVIPLNTKPRLGAGPAFYRRDPALVKLWANVGLSHWNHNARTMLGRRWQTSFLCSVSPEGRTGMNAFLDLERLSVSRRWVNVGLMLGRRRRRRAIIKPTLTEHDVFTDVLASLENSTWTYLGDALQVVSPPSPVIVLTSRRCKLDMCWNRGINPSQLWKYKALAQRWADV